MKTALAVGTGLVVGILMASCKDSQDRAETETALSVVWPKIIELARVGDEHAFDAVFHNPGTMATQLRLELSSCSCLKSDVESATVPALGKLAWPMTIQAKTIGATQVELHFRELRRGTPYVLSIKVIVGNGITFMPSVTVFTIEPSATLAKAFRVLVRRDSTDAAFLATSITGDDIQVLASSRVTQDVAARKLTDRYVFDVYAPPAEGIYTAILRAEHEIEGVSTATEQAITLFVVDQE